MDLWHSTLFCMNRKVVSSAIQIISHSSSSSRRSSTSQIKSLYIPSLYLSVPIPFSLQTIKELSLSSVNYIYIITFICIPLNVLSIYLELYSSVAKQIIYWWRKLTPIYILNLSDFMMHFESLTVQSLYYLTHYSVFTIFSVHKSGV